jgi:methionyl-tRNA formyltransferase
MLAGRSETTRIIYSALSRRFGVDAVVLEEPIPKRDLLVRRARRLGVRRALGQALFQAALVPMLRRAAEDRIAEIKRESGLDGAPMPEQSVIRVSSANAPEAVAALRRLAPRIVVVNGTRILSRETLSSVEAVFLNTHAGITPLYRGSHGGYWALVNGQPEHCGVTVHLVNEGIDTGAIVSQARIFPGEKDSFVTYPLLQVAAALPLLEHAVGEGLKGRLATRTPPPGESRLWTHPTAREYLANRILRNVR